MVDEREEFSEPTISALIDHIASLVRVVNGPERDTIEVSPEVSDILNTYPKILITAAIDELDRRETNASSPDKALLHAATKHVLKVYAQRGSAAVPESTMVSGQYLENEDGQDPTSIDATLDGSTERQQQQIQLDFVNAALPILEGMDPARMPLTWAGIASGVAQILNALGITQRDQRACDIAIRLLSESLEITGKLRRDDEWASQNVTLATLYSESAHGDQDQNELAKIRCYDAALTVLKPEDERGNWAIAQFNRAEALRNLKCGDVRSNIDQAIAAYRRILPYVAGDMSRTSMALISMGLAYAARPSDEVESDLDNAIAALEEALLQMNNGGESRRRGFVHHEAGRCCFRRAALRERTEHFLRSAVRHLEAAADIFKPAALDSRSLDIQHLLAMANTLLADRSHGEVLKRAISHYRTILDIVDRLQNPPLWRMAKLGLAKCLAHPTIKMADQAIDEGIDIFEELLSTLDRGDDRALWVEVENDLGGAYRRRARGDRAANLIQAAACYQSALASSNREAEDQGWVLMTAQLASCHLYIWDEQRSYHIEEAIRLYNEALTIWTDENDFEAWIETLGYLSTAYRQRLVGKKRHNIEMAAHYCHIGLSSPFIAERSEEWFQIKRKLGDALVEAPVEGGLDLIDSAVACYQEIIDVLSSGADQIEFARIDWALGRAYHKRAQSVRSDDLEAAVNHLQRALSSCDRSRDPDLWARINSVLGNVLRERINGCHTDNVEQALNHHQAALSERSQDTAAEEWAESNVNLGAVYLSRTAGDRQENIESAIRCFENALRVMTLAKNGLKWIGTISNLGQAYYQRTAGDKSANLEKALELLLLGIAETSSTDQPIVWATMSTSLGMCHLERVQGIRPENIENAIVHFKNALSVLTRETVPLTMWTQIHFGLARAYIERVNDDRDSNLKASITHFNAIREDVAANFKQIDARQWAELMISLGHALTIRLFDDPARNIEQAIVLFEEAGTVVDKRTDRLLWAEIQHSLGNAYKIRRVGPRSENIELAIMHCKAALETFDSESDRDQWAAAQNNLGNAYLERVVGDRAENIEQALICYRSTHKVRPKDAAPLSWAQTEGNLGFLYSNRLVGDIEDNSRRAIIHLRNALGVLTPDQDRRTWAMLHINLAKVLCERPIAVDGAEPYEEAETSLSLVLETTTRSDPELWGLAHLGLGTICRLQMRAGGVDELTAAVIHYESALSVFTSEDDPIRRAGVLANLASLLDELGDRGDNSLYERAIECATSSLIAPSADSDPVFQVRVRSLLSHIFAKVGRIREARDQLLAAVEARDQVIEYSLTQEVDRLAVGSTIGLGHRLASLSLKLGEPNSAATALESVRAVQLRRALRLDNAWMVSLPEETQRNITEARDRLNMLRRWFSQEANSIEGSSTSSVLEELRAANQHLAQLLDETSFRHPEPISLRSLLSSAPAGGAIIWFIIGDEESAAIIAPAGCTELTSNHVVHLRDVQRPLLREVLSSWWNGYQQAKTLMQSSQYESASLVEAWRIMDTALRPVLDFLWATIMSHVCNALVGLRIDLGCEIVLLPQGDLSMFPLHAAWREVGGRMRAVIDDYTGSYSPSAFVRQTALARLEHRERGGFDREAPENGLLGFFNPMKDTHDALIMSEMIEKPAIERVFARDGRRVQADTGSKASVERLISEAPKWGYVHLSCHGLFDPRMPEAAGLQMAGGRHLTVANVVESVRLNACRWVALSACETAMVDVTYFPDEFVGLQAAFMQAGAPGVMGTFWLAACGPTSLLMRKVYELHFDQNHPRSPAVALREAVLWLRQLEQSEFVAALDPLSAGPTDAASIDPSTSDLGEAWTDGAPSFLGSPAMWASYAYIGV